MLFSVVIICYNQKPHIETMLQCIALQDFDVSDFEVIVVDDGSEQPSKSPLFEQMPYAVRYEFLPRDEHSCRSKARNYGAELANGKYIVFLDGDTLPNPNLLSRYQRYFQIQKTRKVVLGTRAALEWEQSVEFSRKFSEQKYRDIFQSKYEPDERLVLMEKLEQPLYLYGGCWTFFISCNFCIEKQCFVDIGKFDESFRGWGVEDAELGYRLAKAEVKFEVLDNMTLHLCLLPTVEKEKDHYFSWLENVGRFYTKHQSEEILLLIKSEEQIFKSYCQRIKWDVEESRKQSLSFMERCEDILFHKMNRP